MSTPSEESLEDLNAEFSLLLKSNSQTSRVELEKFGNKLRERYFTQIERIEKEFENAVFSNNQNYIYTFLLKYNFIFRAFSANIAIYTDCNLTDDMKVDCVLVGFKPFDPHNLWVTFLKLEKAQSNTWNTKDDMDNYLLPSVAQAKQWIKWLAINDKYFNSRIKEQIKEDLASTGYPETIDKLEIQTDFFIIAGYKVEFTNIKPIPRTSLGDEPSQMKTIKTVTYDSLFKKIYEENSYSTLSSAWWTDNICKSENANVLKSVSFND